MTTAVDRRVKQLQAEERRSAAKARRDKVSARREQAERDVAAAARAAEKVEHKRVADAVEAVRRVAFQAVNRFQDRIVGSRNAGAPVAEPEWLGPMMDATHGLLHAQRCGLVSIRPDTM